MAPDPIEGVWLDLAVMGIGAGAKGAVTGFLKNVLPGVSEDIAAIVAGGALFYFGERIHPLVRKFGAGVLIAGIGQLTKGLMPAIGGGGGGSPSPQAPATTDTLAALAQAQASVTAVYS